MNFKAAILFIFISSLCFAGLPPTASQITGEATNKTTFNFLFPQFQGTRSATSLTVNGVNDPVNPQDFSSKNYVDTVASGLNPLQGVYAASTASIAGSYLNGVACVGATFTTTSTALFAIDSVSPPLNSRVLLKDQGSAFQDGVYNLTVQAVPGVSGAVLTRALDYNTSTTINAGDLIPVINGTVNQKTSWLQTNTVNTCGVDNLSFVEWSYNPATLLSNTLLNSQVFVGNISNIATGVTVSGDATMATNGAITITANAVTNAKAAQMAANTIKGNNTGGLANAIDLTTAQTTAMLDNFIGDAGAGGTKGLVPAPAAGDSAAGKFLAAGGGWSIPSASGGTNFPTTTTATSLALTNANYDVFTDPATAGGSLTVTLFTAVGNSGHHLNIKQISNGTVNITTTGGQTFEFDASGQAKTTAKGQNFTISSDGSNWYVF